MKGACKAKWYVIGVRRRVASPGEDAIRYGRAWIQSVRGKVHQALHERRTEGGAIQCLISKGVADRHRNLSTSFCRGERLSFGSDSGSGVVVTWGFVVDDVDERGGLSRSATAF